MIGSNAKDNTERAAQRVESPLGVGSVPPKGQAAVEITDADYRSIFLPCEAMEERKERPV